MIHDVLENAAFYECLNPHLATAFTFMRLAHLADLPVGRHEVDGDNVYAVVAKGPGRHPADAMLETHDLYIDIQFILSGTDSIGWKARKDLKLPNDLSDARKDVTFYKDAPTVWSAINPGEFGIYFPEDGHMPMISDGELHKVIMKVKAM